MARSPASTLLATRLAVLLWMAAASLRLGAAGLPELPLAQEAAARKIYVAKCAKCHKFYEPNKYSETDWRTWMEKMNKKSKLKPAQAELLNHYLDSYRAGQLPGKPEAKRR